MEKPFEEQAALPWPITFANDILICSKPSERERQISDRLPLLFGERGDTFQLANKPIDGLYRQAALRLSTTSKRLAEEKV